jgi:hypothetical protein
MPFQYPLLVFDDNITICKIMTIKFRRSSPQMCAQYEYAFGMQDSSWIL